MFKSNEHAVVRFTCALLIALSACGDDDSGSSTSPTETGGTGATAGTGTSGSSGAGPSSAPGSSAGRSAPAAPGSGAAGGAGRAGTSGSSAGMSAIIDDDAGMGAAGAGDSGSAAGSGGGGAAAGSGGTMAAAATFTDVYAIMMRSCAGVTCHINATIFGDMLSFATKATAYMNLVGVDSVSCPGEKRVIASDAENSELVAVLAHTQVGDCANTPRMPDNLPMLPASDIDTVRSWVTAGALNN